MPETNARYQSTVTYMQMTAPPRRKPPPPGCDPVLLQSRQIPLPFYRFLYRQVGDPWHWYERRKMDDGTLQALLHSPQVLVLILMVDGAPRGFAELDGRQFPDMELVYFGLTPDMIGRHLGSWFMRETLTRAFALRPNRVWLHTCTEDHPEAQTFYERMGFQVFKRETETVADPSGTLIW